MPQTAFTVKLKNRGLLHLEGTERHAFLQDLITNDIQKLTPDKPLYACLLTPQGKFLHDFFMIEGNGFTLLDCEGGARAQDLFKRLNLYKLRKDVQISVEETHEVYAVLEEQRNGGIEERISGGMEEQRKRGMEEKKQRKSIPLPISSSIPLLPDPRHVEMGHRSFEKPDLPERPFEEWDMHRIALCIPDGSRDLIPEKSTMDEARMDQLGAVDYNKGCYVGQELTARMHYRGLGKKHLQTVRLDAMPEGAELRSSCGDVGIALVRNQS